MEEDVELCLEVQVDPASKRILSNPEKCRSALLDVTVVKPKEMEAFGTQRTNTLRADEVRKLITSMEKQRRKKQKFLDKLKYDDTIIKVRKHDDFSDNYRRSRKPFTKHKERISSVAPIDDLERKDFIGITESVEPLFCEIRRSLKNVETRITNMQDINLVISQTTVDESASEIFPKHRRRHSPFASGNTLRNSSAYRQTPPRDLKSVLVCKNRDRYMGHTDKIEGKCLCENCGIVGLLLECQKRPLLSELSESPPPSADCIRRIQSRKKRTRFNMSNSDTMDTKIHDDLAYINQLTKRVKHLEHRLAMQEERVVPKDYFKKLMSKVVSNISPKDVKTRSEVSISSPPRQEEKKSLKLDEKLVETSMWFDKAFRCKSNEDVKCFRANLPEPKEVKEQAVMAKEQAAIAKEQTIMVTEQNIKIDKSTITDEEIYNANIWRWGEEILKPGIDLKNRIVTLLNDILSKFALSENCSTETSVKASFAQTDRREDYTSDTLKKFMRHMNTKVFNAQVDSKGKFLTRDTHGLNYELKNGREGNFVTHKPTLKDTYRRHHEEYHEKMKNYRQEHHGKVKNYHEDHHEKMKSHYEDHHDKMKNYHEDHNGKVKSHYEDHHDKMKNYHEDHNEKMKSHCEDHYDKMGNHHKDHHPKKESVHYAKNIDVSYVNPKLNQWRKDSHSECKAEDSPMEQRNNTRKGREEFLKIVSKAKQYQKDVLWRNIWNQAKANGQGKTDKITIKIPVSTKEKRNELFETELSIGEVEGILKGS